MPSGRPRLVGLVAALLGSCLASVLLAGCTGDGPPLVPPAARSTAAASTPAAPVLTGSPAVSLTGSPAESGDGVGSPAPVGGSTMTPIPEAAGCTTRSDLGNRAPVRAQQLWPGAGEIGSGAVLVRARSGVAGCDGALPATPDCDLSLPWAGLDAEDLARATGAGSVISGRTFARLAVSSDSARGTASLSYLVLTFAPASDGLASTRGWFDRAVARCSLGRAGSIAGVSGLVGERHKPTLGPGDASRFLLATQGAQLVCLVFEGGAWSPTSREDAVRRVMPLLLAA